MLNITLRPTGFDLRGRGGIVSVRVLHKGGHIDMPLCAHNAVQLAEALAETAQEMTA